MQKDLFHFDDDRASFEDFATENGTTHWDEDLIMNELGYETKEGFRKAMNRAKQACLAISIQIEDHFLRQEDGNFFLTRFACYLLAMNGDTKKPEVAKAQAYFATLAETFQNHLEHAEAIDRVLIRDEVTDGSKSLSSIAKSHGVTQFAFFQNAGYLGMYNMTTKKLRDYKGIPEKANLLDRMGKTELAANLFRITQTADKIQKENIRGQRPLENAAKQVGKKVRSTMEDLSGTSPEDLKAAENISKVRTKLKKTPRNLEKKTEEKKKS